MDFTVHVMMDLIYVNDVTMTVVLQHESVLLQQRPLQQVAEDKAALEKVVTNLQSQLKDLEQLEVEKQAIEAKVQALEHEVKVKVEIIICNESSINS